MDALDKVDTDLVHYFPPVVTRGTAAEVVTDWLMSLQVMFPGRF